MNAADDPRSYRTLMAVVLVGLCIGSAYAVAELWLYDWDPVGVVSVGEADPIRIEYMEDIFDREIALVGDLGHDGKYFFIQAMDPLLLNPEEHGRFLDRPTYRAQRMFYPALAGIFGMFGPEALAWAMLGINVAAFAVGTYATARLAGTYGLSPWWGMAFALNPAVRFELDIDGGGAVGLAVLMVALLMLRRDRCALAVVAMSAAVLSREALLLSAAGIALWPALGSMRRRVAFVGVPALAAGAWAAYVHVQLGSFVTGDSVQEIGPPLGGFLHAFEQWRVDGGLDLVVGVTYLFLSLVVILRTIQRRSLFGLATVGFGIAGLLLTRQVWVNYFDITRALSPLPTMLALSLGVSIFGRVMVDDQSVATSV